LFYFVLNLTMLGTDSRYMYLNFSLVWGRYSMVERGARGVVGLMLIRKETPVSRTPCSVSCRKALLPMCGCHLPRNRPFPSCVLPLCVNTSKPFIRTKMCSPKDHFHANQTHMKGFARGLLLKQTYKVTRKWPNIVKRQLQHVLVCTQARDAPVRK